ncbi:MAG: DNA-deoxyinosine glycosylase [Bacillota bacterium]|nr:MAG: DNA-deoxyinosine glycosylase [Bacillota bacterium]
MEREKVTHTLPPIFEENSRVLVLGSMPSPVSRKVGMYYGNKSNRFWKAISAAFGEAFPASHEEKIDFLKRSRVALWDVLESCEIVGASDGSIRSAKANDFSLITEKAGIAAVFTTGKTAAAYYKKFTGKESVCLPSPSGANCAVSLETLIKSYRQIADAARG